MTDTKKPKKVVTYRPEIFDVADIDSAMRIILTPEAGTTTNERWERETPYLVGEIGQALALDAQSRVLDYGCGIGRVAKGLIERYGCSVIGVDISAGMRELAPTYVGSDRFSVYAPEMLNERVGKGLRVTHAYACWVIQHCLIPDADLELIESALVPGGGFFVLSSSYRCVPTTAGFRDDGISLEALYTTRFECVSKTSLPAAVSTPEMAATSYMMTLRRRG